MEKRDGFDILEGIYKKKSIIFVGFWAIQIGLYLLNTGGFRVMRNICRNRVVILVFFEKNQDRNVVFDSGIRVSFHLNSATAYYAFHSPQLNIQTPYVS